MRYTPITPPKGPLSEGALKLLRVLAQTTNFSLHRWEAQSRARLTGQEFAGAHRSLQRRKLARGTDSWSTPALTEEGIEEAARRGFLQTEEERAATDLAVKQTGRLREIEHRAAQERHKLFWRAEESARIRAKLIPILAQAQEQGWSPEFTALVVAGS
jgi:hypothetical protein